MMHRKSKNKMRMAKKGRGSTGRLTRPPDRSAMPAGLINVEEMPNGSNGYSIPLLWRALGGGDDPGRFLLSTDTN